MSFTELLTYTQDPATEMKTLNITYFVHKLFILVLSGLLASACATADNKIRVNNPLFGIAMEASNMPYTQLEHNAINQLELDQQGQYWIYAETQHDQFAYFVVGGITPIFADSTPEKIAGYDSSIGYVVSFNLNTKHYSIIGTPDIFFDEIESSPGDQVKLTLLQDGVDKAIAAYDGLERLKTKVQKQLKDISILPVLTQRVLHERNIE